MNNQNNAHDVLLNQFSYNPDNLLKVCHAESIPLAVWDMVNEAQIQHGANDKALKAIQSVLNEYSNGSQLNLANAFFDDLIKEAVLENNIPVVLAEIKIHVERFMMCKQISSTFDITKKSLAAMGAISLEINPNQENTIELSEKDDYLSISTACSLSNIASLTYWLYMTNDYAFDGSLIKIDPSDNKAHKAIEILNAERSIKITDKEQTDFRIQVLKLDNGKNAIKLSKVVSKMIALHLQSS